MVFTLRPLNGTSGAIRNVVGGRHTQLRGSGVDRLMAALELNIVTLDPEGTPRQPVSHRMLCTYVYSGSSSPQRVAPAE